MDRSIFEYLDSNGVEIPFVDLHKDAGTPIDWDKETTTDNPQ